nr:hypothetical protein [Mucilaginibacter phyllosphaerae]
MWGKNLLEHNKLYQLRLASTVGLKIPDTIISNNINEIVNFSRNHGDKVACKPLRHTNLVNEADAPVGIYTQMVTTKEFIGRDQSLSIAPMIIQQYIEKKIELRVTIIGHHVFACEIHSQSSDRTKHDWRRYDFENVKHAVHEIPRKISDRILKLMRALRLNYGAMDLIINPEGEYVFLEVNPTGQYGWIEDITGLPISKTFALALIEPTENGIKRYSVQ